MFERWNETIVVNGIERHVEIRWDEVFERYCRIIDRVGLELTKQEDFSEKIDEPCIFCSREKLAKFDEKFGVKQIENDNAFLFPNINPYAKYSSVCAFKKHYIEVGEFSPELIQSNLQLAIEYINKVKKMDDSVRYASINWNYMMPAGASILHPHTQVVADAIPTTYMRKASNEKFEKYIDEELKRERYIKRIGSIGLFVPFVPFGFNEVFGLIEEELEHAIEEIAKAVSSILSYYHSIGRNSFNFSLYYSMENEFPLHFRMITRQNMARYYRNDAMFFERLHFETILERKPEEIAKEIKGFLI